MAALVRLSRCTRLLTATRLHAASTAPRRCFASPPFSRSRGRRAAIAKPGRVIDFSLFSPELSRGSERASQGSKRHHGRDGLSNVALQTEKATWKTIMEGYDDLTPAVFAHGPPPLPTAEDSYATKWMKLMAMEFHATLSDTHGLQQPRDGNAHVHVEKSGDRVRISNVDGASTVPPSDLPKTLLKTQSGWLYITGCDSTGTFPLTATAIAYDEQFKRAEIQADPGRCFVVDNLSLLLYRFDSLRSFEANTREEIKNVIKSGDINACEEQVDVLLPVPEDARANTKLNDSQFDILTKIRAPVDFVQGPPGTGKSTFIVEFVKTRLPKADGSRVLICATTNKAIDSLTEKLAAAGCGDEMLAVGSAARLGETSAQFLIENRVNRHATVEAFEQEVLLTKAFIALRDDYQVAFDAADDHIEVVLAEYESGVYDDGDGEEESDGSGVGEVDEDGPALDLPAVYEGLQLNSMKVKACSKALRQHELIPDEIFLRIKAARLKMRRARRRDELFLAVGDYVEAVKRATASVRSAVRRSIMLKARYFVCTAAVAAALPNRLESEYNCDGWFDPVHFKFDHVILDEAGAMLEPDVIGTVVHGSRSLLMVGDHRQLPPFTKWKKASAHDYNASLMMRLSRNASTTHNMITTQYRMHPQLADIVSSQFYGNALQTALSTKHTRTRRWPVVFVDVKGEEERRGTSFLNRQEIAAVVELVKRERHVNPTQTVSVICFHKPQCLEIRRELVNIGLMSADTQSLIPMLDVCTVDAMQGREADVVILSCVRTSDNGIGFVANRNRANVAVSRAKHGLFIVGDWTALSADAMWRGVLSHDNVVRDS